MGDFSFANLTLRDPRMGAGLCWVSLFASTSTWICCALPILLVTIGAGATLAGITSHFPLFIVLGAYKGWLFAVSGAILAAASGLAWRSAEHCPADPVLARQCQLVRRWNKRILWVSLVVWLMGFLAAYLALPVRMYLDQ